MFDERIEKILSSYLYNMPDALLQNLYMRNVERSRKALMDLDCFFRQIGDTNLGIRAALAMSQASVISQEEDKDTLVYLLSNSPNAKIGSILTESARIPSDHEDSSKLSHVFYTNLIPFLKRFTQAETQHMILKQFVQDGCVIGAYTGMAANIESDSSNAIGDMELSYFSTAIHAHLKRPEVEEKMLKVRTKMYRKMWQSVFPEEETIPSDRDVLEKQLAGYIASMIGNTSGFSRSRGNYTYGDDSSYLGSVPLSSAVDKRMKRPWESLPGNDTYFTGLAYMTAWTFSPDLVSSVKDEWFVNLIYTSMRHVCDGLTGYFAFREGSGGEREWENPAKWLAFLLMDQQVDLVKENHSEKNWFRYVKQVDGNALVTAVYYTCMESVAEKMWLKNIATVIESRIENAGKSSRINEVMAMQEKMRDLQQEKRMLEEEIRKLKKEAAKGKTARPVTKKKESTEILELTRSYKSLAKENEKLKAKNLYLQEQCDERQELLDDLLQDDQEEESLPDIGDLKLVFVSTSDPMNNTLQSAFPDAKITSLAKFSITKYNAGTIDMVVMVSSEVNHSEYYRIKEQCRTHKVPVHHLPMRNVDQIKDSIARRWKKCLEERESA